MTETNQVTFEAATKREADLTLQSAIGQYGGAWKVEKRGRAYHVVQTQTRRERERAAALRQADYMLHDRTFDYFAPGGYLSIYQKRDQLKAALDAWQERFAANPADALTWGTKCFQSAADYHVASLIIADHEAGRDAALICRRVEGEARCMAESDNLSQSSSPTADLMKQAKRIAYGKFAREMRSWLDNRAEAVGALYADEMGLL